MTHVDILSDLYMGNEFQAALWVQFQRLEGTRKCVYIHRKLNCMRDMFPDFIIALGHVRISVYPSIHLCSVCNSRKNTILQNSTESNDAMITFHTQAKIILFLPTLMTSILGSQPQKCANCINQRCHAEDLCEPIHVLESAHLQQQ